jgi:hypothetical protein
MFYSAKGQRRAKDFRVPSEELHVYRGHVHRLSSNKDLKKRLLILTKEDLLVALEGRDVTIERIPLVIKTCIGN